MRGLGGEFRLKRKYILVFAVILLFTFILAACSKQPGGSSDSSDTTEKSSKEINGSSAGKPKELTKLTVSYAGGTCEAPVYVAYHKGFFKDEGLDVSLIKADFEQLKTGLAVGKIDASVGNFAWFKPVEQGLKVKLTGGIHAGCISLVAPPNSGIKDIKGLKGKTIGVDAIGGGPQIILSIELKKQGIDPKKDVQWKAFPPPQLTTAVDKKEIDAFIVWDPFSTEAVKKKNYVSLLDIAADEPYKSGFCCYVTVSDRLLEEDPDAAASYTRAILKAADWVGKNPEKTSRLELDNKYVSANLNENTERIKAYVWKPGVNTAADNIKFFIHEQKLQGILDPSTDENALFDRIFAKVIPDFDGR
jgi:NitT/TauT family transport system substrate-binding protein